MAMLCGLGGHRGLDVLIQMANDGLFGEMNDEVEPNRE